ncbi:SMP-30/gluconolactonase/LRE family protein [Methylobacterium sp. J-030]|uniref:SMP-30/gluconolactonase/LRE family protein n=1 Tax=Methylobacterium sp. J-030 TaxID=2836627 RepID=UPI001FBBF046|nr:SMP-30/gluconolactonase/LRE family protein [Methylobacterium sp. J-030]MCJ2070980.1 SMP-30/gluconolactonase/LRE family protein [Methylobacterium sp. J-030]
MNAEPASDLLRRTGPPEPVPHVDPPRASDPRFTEVVPHHARLVSLYDQAIFGEGPTWWPARDILVWSDVEGRRVLGWHADGCVRVVIDATPFTNGNTVDRDGNLIHCEHGNRRLSRTSPDGRYEADLTGWLWTGLIERISQDQRSWTCGEVRRRVRSRSC